MTTATDEITIAEDGTLKLPKEVLEALGTHYVRLLMYEDGRIVVQPRPKMLHEIEDVAERMRAFETFVKLVSRPSEGSLPDDWATIRDSIYD